MHIREEIFVSMRRNDVVTEVLKTTGTAATAVTAAPSVIPVSCCLIRCSW